MIDAPHLVGRYGVTSLFEHVDLRYQFCRGLMPCAQFTEDRLAHPKSRVTTGLRNLGTADYREKLIRVSQSKGVLE